MTTTSAAQILESAQAQRRAADAAEAALLELAVQWALAHPPRWVDDLRPGDQTAPEGGDLPVQLAGDGTPWVCDLAVDEWAFALGLSSGAGIRLVTEALELRYRLPRLWARLQRGDCPAWRARRVAAATTSLSPDAADWVDTMTHRHIASLTGPGLDRVVREALTRHAPAQAAEQAAAAADRRCVHLDHHPLGIDAGDPVGGTSQLTGVLDTLDALTLDQALAAGADRLAQAGSTDPLDVRRAVALGDLARDQLALDYASPTVDPTTPEPDLTEPRRSLARLHAGRAGRRTDVVVHVHLTAQTLHDGRIDLYDLASTGSCDTTRDLVTAAQVRDWCGRDDARVIVRPVIDTTSPQTSPGYVPSQALADQVRALRPHCVAPYCHRPASACDLDHRVPWPHGPTSTDNLYPLCRRHHRMKTHTGWDYTAPAEGLHHWSSPGGARYTVDTRDGPGVTHRHDPHPHDPHPRAHSPARTPAYAG